MLKSRVHHVYDQRCRKLLLLLGGAFTLCLAVFHSCLLAARTKGLVEVELWLVGCWEQRRCCSFCYCSRRHNRWMPPPTPAPLSAASPPSRSPSCSLHEPLSPSTLIVSSGCGGTREEWNGAGVTVRRRQKKKKRLTGTEAPLVRRRARAESPRCLLGSSSPSVLLKSRQRFRRRRRLKASSAQLSSVVASWGNREV